MQTTIDGLRLAYEDAGNGPALIFVHGFLQDARVWDAQAAALSARYRVIRPDLRGSGRSGCGEGPALMESLAGDIYGLLDRLDVERAIVVGHSLGGYVALAFFRMYAERVAGLGLISTRIGADSVARRAERDALIAAIEARGLDALDAGPLAAPSTPPSIDGICAQIIGMKERVGAEDLLEDMTQPTLLLAGDDDPDLTAELERAAAALADCTLVRLPGVGRLPMREAPDATTQALALLVERCTVSR